IGQAVVSSVLKNNTLIETSEDVSGVLGLCGFLVKDQKDSTIGGGRGRVPMDPRGMAEEQGWVARMVHLFRSDNLVTQFELLQTARRHFSEGGDRIRLTYPPLIASGIQLARRFKVRENVEDDWEARLSSLFKFIHSIITALYNRVEAPNTCLRLFLLSAQVADEARLEELAYEFFVQAFVIYEESISESRAQLQAITGIISALQTSRVFGTDNYDTLITKAALHGSKLLKKSHQATAVLYASHMWWQGEVTGREKDEKLYVDALDRYIYYFEQGVEAVTPKYVNSLVELVTNSIDSVHSGETSGSAGQPGLVDGVGSPDMIVRHFKNTLSYIQTRQRQAVDRAGGEDAEGGDEGNESKRIDWEAVDV
ncbi:MAG: Vacuolar protein sorting-associated protein 35, partial [Tremellales sp. Tagirdzhanova-0007]